MAKKIPLPSLSAEAREVLLRVIGESREPLLAKALATLLTATHPAVESQVTPVLEESFAAGLLRKYPSTTATGKPRYWDRDLQDAMRQAVLDVIQAATGPLTAKEIAGKVVSLKVTEAVAAEIAQGETRTGKVFEFSPAKPKGKPSYWDRDLRGIARDAVLDAALKPAEPFTAKELVSQVVAPIKLSEAELQLVLDEAVAAGKLHAIPAVTAKSKPRFWAQDVLELGARTILRVINSKGPQPQANLKKELKGFDETLFQRIFDNLQGKGEVLPHPPVGTSKSELWGTRPPAPGPYLQSIGPPLKKVLTLLKSAQVPVDDVRRALVQLIEEAGISFGGSGAAASSSSLSTTPAAAVDLVALMKRIEPGAERGALVGARDLRRSAQRPKTEFDSAVMELARQGRLSLHRHDYATSLSQTERDELVTDGDGTYYVGMALRPQ